MKDLVRYRAMESLCRQSAVFHPLDSWRLLAQAEMWHHKAQEEIELHSMRRHGRDGRRGDPQEEQLPRDLDP